MSTGLCRTLEILRRTPNQAANDLLVELALEGSPDTRCAAVDILVESRPPSALGPLVAQFDRLTLVQQDRLRGAGSSSLFQAIRQAYLSDNLQVHDNACAVIREIPAYDQIPLILGSLEKESERKARAVGLIEHLTRALAESLDTDPDSAIGVRKAFLAALEIAFRRFSRHRSAIIPEAFLMLDADDSEQVRGALQNSTHPCHDAMVEALSTRQDMRIIRWVFLLLATTHPPAAIVAILAQRKDPWFVSELLARVSLLSDPTVQATLKQVKAFAWLRAEPASLGSMSADEQSAALLLANASGMPLCEKLAIVAFLLDEGRPEARRVAACTLAQCPGSDATQLVVGCLDDRDPLVQLAAVQQIRQRGLPNALALLMPKLEHPDPRVREGARQSLSDYGFEKFFRSFDQMDERSQHMIGVLVSKIDSDFDSKIRDELTSEHRNHRIRATRILRCLHRIESFWRELAHLVEDEDHVVRRSALEALEDVDDPAVVAEVVQSGLEASTSAGYRRDALTFLAQRGRTSEIRSTARQALSVPARV